MATQTSTAPTRLLEQIGAFPPGYFAGAGSKVVTLVASKELKRLLGKDAGLVGAIVTYDEPTESIARYAPYVLEVNGIARPGG